VPVTFAHPAAAIPLRRFLGRFGVLSALVIGSLVPDLSYFTPWRLSRGETHSLSGLFLWCLPIGLVLYVTFHRFLKGPVLSLLPDAVASRLGRHVSRFDVLPAASWTAVAVSLLCGILTHFVWDSFTHRNGLGVTALPVLEGAWLTVDGYTFYGFRVMQHGGTVLGVALIVLWSWRWLKKEPPGVYRLPVVLPSNVRHALVLTMVAVSSALGLSVGFEHFGFTSAIGVLQAVGGGLTLIAAPALATMIGAYAVGWHCWRWTATSCRSSSPSQPAGRTPGTG
jgi:hypothetical protein